MAMLATGHISRSSTNGSNSGDLSVNDCLHCIELKAELNTLQNEVKSLHEIINLLQSEIKTTRHSETITTDTVSCRNCIKPEKQLRLALEDIFSQKLNTEREKKEAKKKTSNSLQQEETGDSNFFIPTSDRFSVLAAALDQSAGFSIQEQYHGTQPEKMS